jgi:signal transduction histidine kinase
MLRSMRLQFSGVKSNWKDAGPVLVGFGLAFLAALAIGLYVMQAGGPEIRALLQFLLTSSVPSLVIGYLVFTAGRHRLRSIRQKMLLAYGLGVAISIVNIYVTSQMMFLSQHDFVLLSLLLIFAGILAISFGYLLAVRMTHSLSMLRRGVQEIARGNLAERVRLTESDELSEVADAFNRMADELQTAFERQREMEQARRSLIAAVSHDLRTPLSSIGAMVEALADDVVTDRATVRRYYGNVQSQIQNLSNLIDDLFELSQLETGRLQLRLEAVDVNDIVSDTVQTMQAQAVAKGVSLEATFGEEVPVIQAESAKLQRVLYNLTQNAIRHTPAHGSITLATRAGPEGVEIEVADTGEGIRPEDLPYLFERFYRGEKSRSRQTGGAGLGLAIVKGIVEAHQGRIWVESQQGQGACFHLVLPAS